MEWLVCMMIGAALWLAIPAVRNAEHRRIEAHPMVTPNLTAVRVPDPDQELDTLLGAAEAALEADALRRGLQGIQGS